MELKGWDRTRDCRWHQGAWNLPLDFSQAVLSRKVV